MNIMPPASFFNHIYRIKGEQVYEQAIAGDESALKMFEELGKHIGNCLIAILYAMDPEFIVLGGSCWPFI